MVETLFEGVDTVNHLAVPALNPNCFVYWGWFVAVSGYSAGGYLLLFRPGIQDGIRRAIIRVAPVVVAGRPYVDRTAVMIASQMASINERPG